MSNNNHTEPDRLDKASTYEVGGKRFVVQPVFRNDGKETLGSIFLRLATAAQAN